MLKTKIAKNTKIVATLGPASDSKEIIKKMVEAGLNVARINFSHGTHESNGAAIKLVREISKDLDVPIGIIADLQGPRIRVGNTAEFEINPSEIIFISGKKSAGPKELIIDYPGVIQSLKAGDRVLIEDGLMELRIVAKKGNSVKARVINGGIIKPEKGINIPDTNLHSGAVTPKDEKDLEFSLKNNVDFIALSFVSNADEIEETREKIRKILKRDHDLPQIISKIERKEAIKNIDDIIKASDAVMVARGDLGIELDESNVVIYQKEIIARCLKTGKPVIVATQMLDSMINNPIPTRAEVSDVSNAVIDHTDAVMLSGETANGKYPVESVQTMSNIIKNTEDSPFDDLEHGFLGDSHASISAAVAQSAHELAKDSGAKAIVVASVSGFTARMMARHRPEQFLYVMTNSEKTHNQLSLLWGTESFILSDCPTLDKLIMKSIEVLKEKKLLKKKDKIVIVTGRPHVKKEHMSLIKVEEV